MIKIYTKKLCPTFSFHMIHWQLAIIKAFWNYKHIVLATVNHPSSSLSNLYVFFQFSLLASPSFSKKLLCIENVWEISTSETGHPVIPN